MTIFDLIFLCFFIYSTAMKAKRRKRRKATFSSFHKIKSHTLHIQKKIFQHIRICISVCSRYRYVPSIVPLVTSCERRPLLLCGHRLFDAVVEPTVSGLAVAVTVAAALRQWELSVALPPGLLTQFVPVVLNVWLLLQPAMVCLQTIQSKSTAKQWKSQAPKPIWLQVLRKGKSASLNVMNSSFSV